MENNQNCYNFLFGLVPAGPFIICNTKNIRNKQKGCTKLSYSKRRAELKTEVLDVNTI